MNDSIYRPAALAAKRARHMGQPSIATPLPVSLMTAAALLLAGACIAFGFFAQYTKKARVAGLLEPKAGVIKVISPTAGIIVERRIDEGQKVSSGDVLFVISTDQQTAFPGRQVGGAYLAEGVDNQLQQKLASIDADRVQLSQRTAEQRKALIRRIDIMESELTQVVEEQATLRRRAEIAKEALDRHIGLRQTGYVSESAVRQKEDELLEHRARIQALQRTYLIQKREIDAAKFEVEELPRKLASSDAAFKREELSINQQRQENTVKRSVVITAPTDGVATAVVGSVGKHAGIESLATIVPAGTQLEAHLFAPSQAIGLVKAGQSVLIRFAAFPYQKYGQRSGQVLHVSRTPLSSHEMPPGIGTPGGEPLYRISVGLQDQFIEARGERQSLSAGMRVEADILQDRRRIIEWVFEPLLGLAERI